MNKLSTFKIEWVNIVSEKLKEKRIFMCRSLIEKLKGTLKHVEVKKFCQKSNDKIE